MSSLNSVTLIGRLGRDPELRMTQSGTAVCNFSIATDTRVKEGDEWGKRTEWHRITAWGRQAEICEQYLHKGDVACIQGSIKYGKYTDRDGNEKPTVEIVAREVVFMPGGERRGSTEGGQSTTQRQDTRTDAQRRRDEEPAPFSPEDDEIPF